MPRLRKQSSLQRQRLSTNRVNEFRERNPSDRLRNAISIAARRQDVNFREEERERDRVSRQLRRHNSFNRRVEQIACRQDETYRLSEQQRNTAQRSVRREDVSQRQVERDRDAISHRVYRHDEVYRQLERERDALNHEVRRQDEVSRQFERERDSLNHQVRWQNEGRNENYRQIEREMDSQRRNVQRRDITYRTIEQVRNTQQRREARQNASLESQEQNRIRNCRVLIHRMNPYNREEENNHQSERNAVIRQNLSPESRREMLQADSIRHRSRQLREFYELIRKGYNRQCAVRGAVTDTTVNVLPRAVNQTEVVQVHIKRRLQYEHSFMTETIRPAKIFEAARYLINTELYRKHNIVLSNEWLNSMNCTEECPFVSNVEDLEFVSRLSNTNFIQDDVEEVNPQEPLLDNNPVENVPLQRISIAPGEGQRPLDMLLDEDSEELSYPIIYCGVKRNCNATIGKIIKSEV
ncbi:apical junction molecule-like [Musca domestica]|uniref:Apical junction molecule-like n=1 Tax=Musca domestica TaxID=7370 RepID=A0ABM3VAD5_MUSDO|nr:apical junction molecule-like [Musca domestica]